MQSKNEDGNRATNASRYMRPKDDETIYGQVDTDQAIVCIVLDLNLPL